MSGILAITLDLDDTLWPVRPVLIEAEKTLGAWLGRNAPETARMLDSQNRARLRAQVIESNPERAHDVSFIRLEVLRQALGQVGEDQALAAQAFEVFLEARQRVTPYDDVIPVLERWSRRYRLVAITNGNADLARIGLAGYFSDRIAAHELGYAKPDPRIFHEACRRVGVAPAQALHVGDDLHLDVLAADDAGLRSAWVRRPDLVGARGAPPDEPAPPWFPDLDALDAHLHGPGVQPAGDATKNATKEQKP